MFSFNDNKENYIDFLEDHIFFLKEKILYYQSAFTSFKNIEKNYKHQISELKYQIEGQTGKINHLKRCCLEERVYRLIIRYEYEFFKFSKYAKDINIKAWDSGIKNWYNKVYMGTKTHEDTQEMFYRFFQSLYSIFGLKLTCFLCSKEIKEKNNFVGHHCDYPNYIFQKLGYVIMSDEKRAFFRFHVYCLCKKCHNLYHSFNLSKTITEEQKKLDKKMYNQIKKNFKKIFLGKKAGG